MSLIKSIVKFLLQRGVFKSYAQFGEDLIIRPYLPKKNGVYVDVGCYHPLLYSNTYRLYRTGWSGIVIDPNPNIKKLFDLFRARDQFFQTAVGSTGVAEYHMFVDGAYNTLDGSVAETYKARTKFLKTIPVPVKPLAELCSHVTHIDLMSVDVEGFDLEVLQTHDWLKPPTVIIVETQPQSSVAEFLYKKGYTLAGLTKLNSIFLKTP